MNTANTVSAGRRAKIAVTSGRGGMPVTEGKLAAYYVGREYINAVVRAGGTPFIFPAVAEDVDEVVDAALESVDGLVLPGGCDLSPQLYGAAPAGALDADPVRDRFELAMLEGAVERGLPVLGICRGMELINVWRGGSLRNGVFHPGGSDIHVDALGRVRVHQVEVADGTLARRVFGRPRVEATCVHHQGPDTIGDGLVTSVLAADGAVEAVEDADQRLLGVIWHPELGLDRTPTHQLVYDWVVREALDGPQAGPAPGGRR
ncbi:MAG: gamma-glutamyl-gamma-aminobutyrate hydrolase family protein [Solirubrobacterales bacterium]